MPERRNRGAFKAHWQTPHRTGRLSFYRPIFCEHCRHKWYRWWTNKDRHSWIPKRGIVAFVRRCISSLSNRVCCCSNRSFFYRAEKTSVFQRLVEWYANLVHSCVSLWAIRRVVGPFGFEFCSFFFESFEIHGCPSKSPPEYYLV